MNTREAKARCNHCGVIGHFLKHCPQVAQSAENCPEVKSKVKEDKAYCNHCGIIGHFKKNCLQLKPKIEEPKVEPIVTLTNAEEVSQMVTQCQPDMIIFHMADGSAYRKELRHLGWSTNCNRGTITIKLRTPSMKDPIFLGLTSCKTLNEILEFIAHHEFQHLTVYSSWERILKVLSDNKLVAYRKVDGGKSDFNKIVYTELFDERVFYDDVHNDLPLKLRTRMLAAYSNIVDQPLELVEELHDGKTIALKYV